MSPGHCCKKFNLGGGDFGRRMSELEVLVALATIPTCLSHDGTPSRGPPRNDSDTHALLGLPFVPIEKSDSLGWLFACTLLDEQGRCSDYEHRPALCRAYVPRSDPLCIMHESHMEEAECHKKQV